MQLVALPQTLKCIKNDLYADESGSTLARADRLDPIIHLQEKDTVSETRQGVDLAVPVREACVGAPLAHDCCCQTNSKTSTVEQHMDAVGEQTQRATDKAIEELYNHEAEVEDAEVRDSS